MDIAWSRLTHADSLCTEFWILNTVIYIRITFLGVGFFLTVSLELLIKYADQTYRIERKKKCSLVYKMEGAGEKRGIKIV